MKEKADSSSPLPKHISARGAQFHVDSLQSRRKCSKFYLGPHLKEAVESAVT